MRCKLCDEEVGRYYSQLEEHLWVKHRGVIMRWLGSMKASNRRNGK